MPIYSYFQRISHRSIPPYTIHQTRTHREADAAAESVLTPKKGSELVHALAQF